MSIMDVPTMAAGPRRNLLRRKAAFAALGVVVSVVAFVGVRHFAALTAPSSSAQDAPTLGFMPLASPRMIADIAFEDADGNKRTLAQFRGKSVLLNVWATWCGPCRKEMPALDRLQAKLGSDDFQVVALSIDRGGVAAVKSFYDEIDVRSLGIYVDSTTDAQANLGIVGVPTTLLVDREGREVARYTGPADWDGPSVAAAIRRYLPSRKQ
jgi:thiol-disulfide isomerase/thioredoxin